MRREGDRDLDQQALRSLSCEGRGNQVYREGRWGVAEVQYPRGERIYKRLYHNKTNTFFKTFLNKYNKLSRYALISQALLASWDIRIKISKNQIIENNTACHFTTQCDINEERKEAT